MLNNSIEITSLSADEWEKYREIRLEALKEEPLAFNSTFEEAKNKPQSYWKEVLANTNNIFAFANHDGCIVGTMNVAFAEEEENDDVAVIHGAYVNRNFRNAGVGRSLLNFLINEVKKHNKIRILKLWVRDSQSSAIQLYENLGFKFTQRADEHTLIMEKKMA